MKDNSNKSQAYYTETLYTEILQQCKQINKKIIAIQHHLAMIYSLIDGYSSEVWTVAYLMQQNRNMDPFKCMNIKTC